MRHWRMAQLAMVFALLAVIAAQVQAASRYSVTLEPPSFGVDEASELTITVTGDEDAAPIVPHVPGLVINPDGQSSSIQQVNGAVTAIFSRTYRVTADQAGTYTIPPIQIGNYRSAALVVHVGAAGSGRRTSPSGDDSDDDSAPPANAAAALQAATPMIKVVLPKSQVYAGELVPIQVKAYLHEGVGARNAGPLAVVGDAFTVNGLEKLPVRSEEMLGGMRYLVWTWNAVLGALKSGKYPLAFELPATVSVRLRGPDSDMAARLRSMFGTSSAGAFMDDSAFASLFGRVVEKSVTAKSDPLAVTVLPLPVMGRPADFSGAVGQFQVASEVAPASGPVGDPLTFKLTVTGKGNLSRVNSAGLHDSPQWRAYHTESKVTADDDTGRQGFKTFTQPVVPRQAGQLSLPSLSFSYFDPEAGRYVTRETQPISVTVTPSAGSSPAAATLQTANAAPGGADSATGDTLAPDVAVTGHYSATLVPLVWRRWFIGATVAPVLLMLAAVTMVRRQQRRSGDPTLMLHAARLAAVKMNLEAMAGALHRGDSPAFFTAARHALQERLADLWQVPAESVDQRMVAERLPQQEGAQLRAIFAMAEKATYAAESPGAQALREWQRRVLEQMDRLEMAR
ncbi:MAG TPA: BatD family protein [Steroidobacteraceae bacterium]